MHRAHVKGVERVSIISCFVVRHIEPLFVLSEVCVLFMIPRDRHIRMRGGDMLYHSVKGVSTTAVVVMKVVANITYMEDP